jgi:hypothetical protein
MNTTEQLRQCDSYELGVSAAWIYCGEDAVIELARSAAQDAAEFERGLADGKAGIGIVRHADRVEFKQTGRRPSGVDGKRD